MSKRKLANVQSQSRRITSRRSDSRSSLAGLLAISDTAQSPAVAVVSETFAERFLGQGNPVGKTFGDKQDGGQPDKIYQRDRSWQATQNTTTCGKR